MNLTTHFTEEMMSLAQSYSANGNEATAAWRGSFAEYAMVFFDETSDMIIDRIEVMPPILDLVRLEPGYLPH